MPKHHARVVELDILRAVAIIFIVFGHVTYWQTAVKDTLESGLAISFGLLLFFFISGYVLHLNHPSFPQRNSLVDFYKKRALRIFPLYWLAIVVTFVFVSPPLVPLNTFVIVLGLQSLLSPRLDTAIWWWFVGTILVYYMIYPLIAALASDTLNLPAPMNSSVFKFAIMLIVPFLIFAVARSALFIIANSIFYYYGIFALGVAVSNYNILGRYGFLTDNRTRLLKYVAVAAVPLTAAIFAYPLVQSTVLSSANPSSVSSFASYGGLLVVLNAMFVLFILVAFCLVRILVISSSKASRPLSHAVWYRALLLISFSSYAIYLFFMPVLGVLIRALMRAQLTALEIGIIMIFVGMPTLVVIAFVLQSTQNEILNRIKKYRAASSPSPDSNELQ
jgi:peptidoglycan/LPS O-acetylase OafA/YrhL